MPPESVHKRDGRVVPYDRGRIVRAVERAAGAVAKRDERAASAVGSRDGRGDGPGECVAGRATERVEEALAGRTSPSVEEIQDAVEAALIALGATEVAKAYILYRRGRADSRRALGALGVRDDLKLGPDVVRILEERYLRRDGEGRVCETPRELFRRVARAVGRAELAWGSEADSKRVEEAFFRALSAREFLPNSPCLMNAGTGMGQLAACFVLPVEDSIDGIFRTLGAMAKIHQSGGGTGFSFSRLRPEGDIVASTGGVASGPVSFMTVYDSTTDVIRQGGRRRGANMGVLDASHPDIMKFVRAKSEGDSLRNFNLSVAATDSFIEAARRGEGARRGDEGNEGNEGEEGGEYDLVNPRTGERAGRANAAAVLDLIATNAWASGEPGMIFLDAVNRANPTPGLGRIEATNPCGEQPLLPYESCVLGSVNLVSCLARSSGRRDAGGRDARSAEAEIDWDKLARLVALGVRFLDDCIEASRYPMGEIERATRGNRKVGLGVMGFADLLYEVGLAYDSEEAVALGERIMAFVNDRAHEASRALARERGPFPNFERSALREEEPRRNAAVTTVAPTGTLSLIAGTSSGIEPRFALVSLRVLLAGTRMLETVPAFERTIRARGLAAEPLLAEVARTGSVRGTDKGLLDKGLPGGGVPDDVRRVFATALDIAPEWHVRMQAAFQRHTDSAVSKTVNLPPEATPQDVKRVFLLAHELGCKGITVYRYGSREGQVLSLHGGPPELRGDSCGPGRDCVV